MSKQEEAGLILKLYELRRDETMRKARNWYIREFHPETIADFNDVMFSERSNYLRMVITYWDMAAALVTNGAISRELFTETNTEYLAVFAKIEPLLGEIRAAYGQRFAGSLEKMIDAMPDGRERVAEAQGRLKAMRARLAGTQTSAARQA